MPGYFAFLTVLWYTERSCLWLSLPFPAVKTPGWTAFYRKKVITFDSRGGSPVEPQILFRNETIRDPGSPLEPPQEHSATGKNWEFGYWGAIMDPENVESDNPDYINGSTFPDLLGIWNFDTIPDGDMTLYAVWTEY